MNNPVWQENSKKKVSLVSISAVALIFLLALSSARAASAIDPGPIQIGFLGQFQLQVVPGAAPSTFFVGALLFGFKDPGPAGTPLSGFAIIVERDPGPIQRISLFTISGTLSVNPNDPSGASSIITFNLKDPGPSGFNGGVVLLPGTNFNFIIRDPGPSGFEGTAVLASGAPLAFSGSGFVQFNQ